MRGIQCCDNAHWEDKSGTIDTLICHEAELGEDYGVDANAGVVGGVSAAFYAKPGKVV